jgi:TPR repeat protein
MYATGQGVAVDGAHAARWYALAAAQGDASAQNNLGVLYATGDGLPRDDVRAVHWYHAAAEQDHTLAQYNLSSMVASGRAGAPDPVHAHMWMLLAASSGDAQARACAAAAAERLAPRQLAAARDLARAWRHNRS